MSENKQKETKQISREEVLKATEDQINNDLSEVETQISLLSHGQKTRLLIAEAKYPIEETSFSNEPELAVAFSTMKRLKDSLVAYGVEITVSEILKKSQEKFDEEQKSQKGENNG